MVTISLLAGVLQSIFISLGVGSSTLAILNFFSAISDGTIDETERRMMGIVYVILRIAMVGIALTTVALLAPGILQNGLSALSVTALGQCILVGVLFLNAILMTKRIMPSTFGPGIQAGTWYTLGIITALQALGSAQDSIAHLFLWYLITVGIAVLAVNITMKTMRSKR